MTPPTVKSTDFINAAAAVQTKTRKQPEVIYGPGGYACFGFPATDEVLQAFDEYEAGTLMVNAKSLLINRSNLLKLVKGGSQ